MSRRTSTDWDRIAGEEPNSPSRASFRSLELRTVAKTKGKGGKFSSATTMAASDELGEDAPLLSRQGVSPSLHGYGSSIGFDAEEEARKAESEKRENLFLGSVSSLISGSYVNIEVRVVEYVVPVRLSLSWVSGKILGMGVTNI